jgi:hypothetical protein
MFIPSQNNWKLIKRLDRIKMPNALLRLSRLIAFSLKYVANPFLFRDDPVDGKCAL